MFSKDIRDNQELNEESLQLSTRVVSYIPGGYLGRMSDKINFVQNVNDRKFNQKLNKGDNSFDEGVINDVPLSKPEYYYYPPEIISDSRDFLDDKERKEFKLVGRGLVNPGWNTCYLNSILQALTYAPFLSIDCLKKTHRSICKYKLENLVCLMCMFEEHVNLVFQDKDDEAISNDKAVVPNFIKCAQKLIWKKFRIGMMQDAQEFLRFFLEALHKACLPKKLQSNEVFRRLNPITASTTYIGQLFCGFFRSRIICSNCEYISNTYDPFMDIPLDIMGVSNLENAFKLFTKIEYLKDENRYKCPNCKQKSDASKQLLIEKLPPLLTIQLKRFSFVGHGSRKPNKAIDFPETLNLRPFMAYQDSISNQNVSQIYKLWAVVCHSGNTLSCGHYYTHAKSINNQWYCFNDEYVKPTNLDTVLNEKYKAYLLFYYKTDFNRDFAKGCDVPNFIYQYTLAPELSFVNFEKNLRYKSSNSAESQIQHKFENINEFLDNLSLKNIERPKIEPEVNSNNLDINVIQNDDIRLVLTPNSVTSSLISENPKFVTLMNSTSIKTPSINREQSLNIIKSPKMSIKSKRTMFKLKLFLFINWNIISRTRRNLKNIILYRKPLMLCNGESNGKNHLDSSITNYSLLKDSSIIYENEKILKNINLLKTSNKVDKWDDLEITVIDEHFIEDAQKSLLPKSNIRSEYDREYDKGKIKKPLRQALKQDSKSINNQTTNFKDSSRKYLGGAGLENLTNKQLFDIASRNKANFKNNNKRKYIKVK